jgi:hypothetical protein
MRRSSIAAVFVLAALGVAGCSGTSPVEPTPIEEVAPAPPVVPAAPPLPRQQYPGNGPDVVAHVTAKYPDRLAGGVSLDERRRNMEFLRDRVIETGICGGMNLAWNLKRGVGPRSIDAIDWRHGERDINDVVDLALGWDDTGRPLQLHWQVTAGPAGWEPFPQPRCE